jgi:hypothetical protein
MEKASPPHALAHVNAVAQATRINPLRPILILKE